MRVVRDFFVRSCHYLNKTQTSSVLWSSSCPISPVRRFTTLSSLRQSIEMETVNTTERLKSLRQLMKKHEVDIYGIADDIFFVYLADVCTVVPSEDSHQSEYIAPTDARRSMFPAVAEL